VVGTSGREEVAEKGGRSMNTVQKCVHMYVNVKMIPVKIVLRIREGGIKESSEGGELKNDTFDKL
jgi:hypothetical protein